MYDFITKVGLDVFEYAMKNGGDNWKGSRTMWANLTDDQQEDLGVWAGVQAERQSLRNARPAIAPNPGGVGLIFKGRRPEDYVVAIDTGRKPVRDLTRQDCFALAGPAQAKATTYGRIAQAWRGLGNRLEDGQTISDLTLTDEDQAELAFVLNIRLARKDIAS